MIMGFVGRFELRWAWIWIKGIDSNEINISADESTNTTPTYSIFKKKGKWKKMVSAHLHNLKVQTILNIHELTM